MSNVIETSQSGYALRQTLVTLGLLLASLAAIALVVGISVGIGDMPIPLATTYTAITNKLGWTAVELNRIHESVIWDYRLSRALVAAFCGAGLAISGAIMQSLLRNPLAEPYVLGISAGASTGAVCIVILGVGAGTVSLSAGALPVLLRPFSSSLCCPTAPEAVQTAPSWPVLPPPSSSMPPRPMW